MGEFTCEVQAVSSTGHGVLFSQVLQVDSVNTTVDDLVGSVHTTHKTCLIFQQEYIISYTSGPVAALAANIPF